MLRPTADSSSQAKLTSVMFTFDRFQSEVSFRPYTCHAAVLFVDLSHYSKIAAFLADRGAHTISSIVNAYLSRLLAIISKHGGDVVKFAGDAVLVVWEGKETELEINLLTAAKCVMELQEAAGSHPVEGTSLHFRIHCGLTSGKLESEIFVAPVHENMQRLYHVSNARFKRRRPHFCCCYLSLISEFTVCWR